MRQIEKQMIEAIVNKKSWKTGNTEVVYQPALGTSLRSCIEHARVYLHGNHIGTYVYSQKDNQGNNIGGFVVNKETFYRWPTRTTKSRLKALGIDYKAL